MVTSQILCSNMNFRNGQFLIHKISFKQLSRPTSPIDDRDYTPSFLNLSQIQQGNDKPYKPKFHTALYTSNESSCSSTGATINSANNTPRKDDHTTNSPSMDTPPPSLGQVYVPNKHMPHRNSTSSPSTSQSNSTTPHYGLVSKMTRLIIIDYSPAKRIFLFIKSESKLLHIIK